jgi:hypothetical protein
MIPVLRRSYHTARSLLRGGLTDISQTASLLSRKSVLLFSLEESIRNFGIMKR